MELNHPEESPQVTLQGSPPGQRLAGRRFLVVDDSHINRDLTARVLEWEGAETVTANDGRQALDLLGADPRGFDAVLMDVQMPVMGGLTAIRTIRRELGLTGLPVVAVTADVLYDERQKALDAGADDFLAKPVTLEEMVAMLLGLMMRPADSRSRKVPREVPPPADAARDGSLPAAEERGGQDGEGMAPGIPELPGFDTALVTASFGNDGGFFREMLGMFLSRFGDAAQQIRAELEQGDRQAAARRLHALKGTAGSLGGVALMESARDLEKAIVDGEPDVEPLVARMDAHLASLAALAALRPPERARRAPISPGAPTLDPARLHALRHALAHHDLASLDLFDELEPAISALCGRVEAGAMAEAIRHLRFAEVLRLLQRVP